MTRPEPAPAIHAIEAGAAEGSASRAREVVNLAAIRDMRQRAAALRAELTPPPTRPGWSKGRSDLRQLIAIFPGLRLKPGLMLTLYQYRGRDLSTAVAWAMPRRWRAPSPAACVEPGGSLHQVPRPKDALEQVMEGIEGDGSPQSYLWASLLARELMELGDPDPVTWTHHEIIGDYPPEAGPEAARWRWFEDPPMRWGPLVAEEASGGWQVSFYTYTRIGAQRIQRCHDVYLPDSYAPRTRWLPVAKGPLLAPLTGPPPDLPGRRRDR